MRPQVPRIEYKCHLFHKRCRIYTVGDETVEVHDSDANAMHPNAIKGLMRGIDELIASVGQPVVGFRMNYTTYFWLCALSESKRTHFRGVPILTDKQAESNTIEPIYDEE